MNAPAPAPLEMEDKITVAKSDFLGILALLRFGKGVYLRLAGAFALIVAGSAAVMVSARVLGQLVEALVSGGLTSGSVTVAQASATFLTLETFAVIAQYYGRLGLSGATIEITYRVRLSLFDKLRTLPITYFDQQPLGRTITRLTSDVEGMENFFSGTMARVLNGIINIIAVLIAMVLTDPAFGLMMVAASLPSLAFTVALRGPIRYWLRTYRRYSAQLNAQLAEYLSGMSVIRIFGLERWTQTSFDAGADDLLRSGIMVMNWNSFIRPITLLLCSLPTLLILWLGGERVLTGAMALGTFVAFVRFSERFIAPIRMISQEIQNIQEALVSSERVRRMLGEEEEDNTLGPDGSATPVLQGDVVYDDVWMGYGGKPVLKGVSFVAKRGMKVALVGATGSGKSSTINLLPRLYPFNKGSITLDGTPIEAISRQHLRQQLGYVSQDVIVFSGTIRDNLLAALPQVRRQDQVAAEAALEAASRQTGLHAIMSRFPKGLDYQVLEGGDNLSMGERQLIAFTRMLLRNPSILILDEATANIDEDCERLVQTAISEVMTGRTSFVIAHRLSTIVQCDLILVFQDGSIIERGTHAQLMAMHGVYATLAARQLSAASL